MLNVMLIDDENNVLLGLSRLIDWAANDARICGTFTDPVKALEEAGRLQPDVIMSDIEMPGMTGLELIAALTEKVPDSLFVILSAYDDFQYAKQAVALGVYRYLVKPLPSEELVGLLTDIHKKKNAKNANAENTADTTRNMIRSLVLQDIIQNGSSLRLSDHLSYYEQLDTEGPFLLASLRFVSMARNVLQDGSEITSLLDAMKPPVLFHHGDEILFLIREQGNTEKLNEFRNVLDPVCSLKTSEPFFRLRDSHAAYLALTGEPGVPVREEFAAGSEEFSAYTQDQLIRKAEEYIENHYSDEEFRLSDVADALFVNNSYLSHLYKVKTGNTLFNFLLEARMKHAATLIRHSEYSVNDIARMVGYPAVKNFYAAFQKHFGESPKSYKKKQK